MKGIPSMRKFAAQQQISEEDALDVGLEQKAREFVEKGSELYVPKDRKDNLRCLSLVQS
jgi:phosphomethylpyrimidine synthase